MTTTAPRPKVPGGLRDLMKELTREILKEKPTNIYEFAESYFQSHLPEKDNYAVKDFEPVTTKYDFSYIKNPQRYPVPVTLVYSIIPEGLTMLVKDLIKAVLREQPQNLCEFAVEYFRHLRNASNAEESNKISYAAYENYFQNKERYLFTPFVKCTCGRTFGEGFGTSYSDSNITLIPDCHGLDLATKLAGPPIDITDGKHNNNKEEHKSSVVYSEEYVKAIYIIQRFYRRYLTRKHSSKNSPPNENIMSDEMAAIIIQRSLRKLFERTRGGYGAETTQDLLPTVPQLQLSHNENDNISEAASYTSASTAVLSASESGRETLEISPAENIVRETIIEGEEQENDQYNASICHESVDATEAEATKNVQPNYGNGNHPSASSDGQLNSVLEEENKLNTSEAINRSDSSITVESNVGVDSDVSTLPPTETKSVNPISGTLLDNMKSPSNLSIEYDNNNKIGTEGLALGNKNSLHSLMISEEHGTDVSNKLSSYNDRKETQRTIQEIYEDQDSRNLSTSEHSNDLPLKELANLGEAISSTTEELTQRTDSENKTCSNGNQHEKSHGPIEAHFDCDTEKQIQEEYRSHNSSTQKQSADFTHGEIINEKNFEIAISGHESTKPCEADSEHPPGVIKLLSEGESGKNMQLENESGKKHSDDFINASHIQERYTEDSESLTTTSNKNELLSSDIKTTVHTQAAPTEPSENIVGRLDKDSEKFVQKPEETPLNDEFKNLSGINPEIANSTQQLKQSETTSSADEGRVAELSGGKLQIDSPNYRSESAKEIDSKDVEQTEISKNYLEEDEVESDISTSKDLELEISAKTKNNVEQTDNIDISNTKNYQLETFDSNTAEINNRDAEQTDISRRGVENVEVKTGISSNNDRELEFSAPKTKDIEGKHFEQTEMGQRDPEKDEVTSDIFNHRDRTLEASDLATSGIDSKNVEQPEISQRALEKDRVKSGVSNNKDREVEISAPNTKEVDSKDLVQNEISQRYRENDEVKTDISCNKDRDNEISAANTDEINRKYGDETVTSQRDLETDETKTGISRNNECDLGISVPKTEIMETTNVGQTEKADVSNKNRELESFDLKAKEIDYRDVEQPDISHRELGKADVKTATCSTNDHKSEISIPNTNDIDSTSFEQTQIIQRDIEKSDISNKNDRTFEATALNTKDISSKNGDQTEISQRDLETYEVKADISNNMDPALDVSASKTKDINSENIEQTDILEKHEVKTDNYNKDREFKMSIPNSREIDSTYVEQTEINQRDLDTDRAKTGISNNKDREIEISALKTKEVDGKDLEVTEINQGYRENDEVKTDISNNKDRELEISASITKEIDRKVGDQTETNQRHLEEDVVKSDISNNKNSELEMSASRTTIEEHFKILPESTADGSNNIDLCSIPENTEYSKQNIAPGSDIKFVKNNSVVSPGVVNPDEDKAYKSSAETNAKNSNDHQHTDDKTNAVSSIDNNDTSRLEYLNHSLIEPSFQEADTNNANTVDFLNTDPAVLSVSSNRNHRVDGAEEIITKSTEIASTIDDASVSIPEHQLGTEKDINHFEGEKTVEALHSTHSVKNNPKHVSQLYVQHEYGTEDSNCKIVNIDSSPLNSAVPVDIKPSDLDATSMVKDYEGAPNIGLQLDNQTLNSDISVVGSATSLNLQKENETKCSKSEVKITETDAQNETPIEIPSKRSQISDTTLKQNLLLLPQSTKGNYFIQSADDTSKESISDLHGMGAKLGSKQISNIIDPSEGNANTIKKLSPTVDKNDREVVADEPGTEIRQESQQILEIDNNKITPVETKKSSEQGLNTKRLNMSQSGEKSSSYESQDKTNLLDSGESDKIPEKDESTKNNVKNDWEDLPITSRQVSNNERRNSAENQNLQVEFHLVELNDPNGKPNEKSKNPSNVPTVPELIENTHLKNDCRSTDDETSNEISSTILDERESENGGRNKDLLAIEGGLQNEVTRPHKNSNGIDEVNRKDISAKESQIYLDSVLKKGPADTLKQLSETKDEKGNINKRETIQQEDVPDVCVTHGKTDEREELSQQKKYEESAVTEKSVPDSYAHVVENLQPIGEAQAELSIQAPCENLLVNSSLKFDETTVKGTDNTVSKDHTNDGKAEINNNIHRLDKDIIVPEPNDSVTVEKDHQIDVQSENQISLNRSLVNEDARVEIPEGSHLGATKLSESKDNSSTVSNVQAEHRKVPITDGTTDDNHQHLDIMRSETSIAPDNFAPQGVLNGPDIRKLFKSNFDSSLDENHSMAWIYLQRVCTRVLGGDRDAEPEAREWVKQMLHYFEIIGASMTLKLHFLHFHFDDFIKQLPTESDEQGERFHQTTMPIEKRYKGKNLDALLAEVCWWSHKITLYDVNEVFEEERADDGGQSGSNVPVDTIIAESESDSDDLDPQLKRARFASPGPSTL